MNRLVKKDPSLVLRQFNDIAMLSLKSLSVLSGGFAMPDLLTKPAVDVLLENWRSVDSKFLLVDCFGLVSMLDHVFDGLKERTGWGNCPIVFCRLNHGFSSGIEVQVSRKLSLGFDRIAGSSDGEPFLCFQPKGSSINFPLESVTPILVLENQKYADSLVADTFGVNADSEFVPLSSTPILSNGVFNARRIISDSVKFSAMVCMLEELLLEGFSFDDDDSLCLLSGSLRGGPFASALAFARARLKPFEVLDHLGPSFDLLEEHEVGKVTVGRRYVYVGDFIVGGTELKLASNWATGRGSSVVGALFLGSLWSAKNYETLGMKVLSLVNLRQCCPQAQYEV